MTAEDRSKITSSSWEVAGNATVIWAPHSRYDTPSGSEFALGPWVFVRLVRQKRSPRRYAIVEAGRFSRTPRWGVLCPTHPSAEEAWAHLHGVTVEGTLARVRQYMSLLARHEAEAAARGEDPEYPQHGGLRVAVRSRERNPEPHLLLGLAPWASRDWWLQDGLSRGQEGPKLAPS